MFQHLLWMHNHIERGLPLKDATMNDDEFDPPNIADRLAVELAWKGHGPMECVLRPVSVFQIVAALQLARRHPQFAQQEAVAACTEQFIAGAREYFKDCPTVLEIIRRGDDAAYDEPP